MKRKLTAAILLLGLCHFEAQAGIINISVDGDLSDWGVQRTGNASDWTPKTGIHYTVEDQTGGLNVRLEAGYGGQAYDAEALYAYMNDTHLYIALATGHNPNTLHNPGANSFGAGDFAIDFGRDGTYELGINVKPGWDNFGVAAGVYKDTQWAYGLWADGEIPGYKKSDHPTAILDGTWLGQAQMAISGPQTGYGAWTSDTHYFYEIAVGLDLLSAGGWTGESFNIHWTQLCANDTILVDPPASVPEPETLMLLLTGLLGVGMIRRRKAVDTKRDIPFRHFAIA